MLRVRRVGEVVTQVSDGYVAVVEFYFLNGAVVVVHFRLRADL